MILIPIASFLAGALLSILLPIALLIGLTVWYVMFIRRVPDTSDWREPAPPEAPAGAPQTGGSPGQEPAT